MYFRITPRNGITVGSSSEYLEASTSNSLSTDLNGQSHPYEVSSEIYEGIMNTVTSSGSPGSEMVDGGGISVKKEDMDSLLEKFQDYSVAR